jgi:nitroreductase
MMDVLEAIRTRRSVRRYKADPIPDKTMERLRQALRFAPSACNFQPWHFVFVTDPEHRAKLARASHGQTWMAEAPLTVVACGLPDLAYRQMGGYGNSVDVDVAIALDHLTLAAVADGLGTCWIGAFEEGAVKSLLGIPPGVKVVAMTPVGYPASPELIYPITEERRKSEADIFSIDRYKGPATDPCYYHG